MRAWHRLRPRPRSVESTQMRMTVLRRWLLPILLGLGAAAAVAGDDPRDWLDRMNSAITTRNYDGTFFHVRGGVVETLRIIHRVRAGEVTERLISLDGSGREFVRSGAELMCYLPDERAVLVEQRPADGMLLGNLPRFDASTSAHYEMRQLERGRLMGRDARVVEVVPRDEFRYGYRLWIDEQTAMPLKTQLCDGQGNVIEQVVFSSLELPENIPDSAFKPQMSTEGFRWLRHKPRTAEAAAAAAPPVLWDAMKLPPGFRVSSSSSQLMPGSDTPVSHVVLSDGVASVSVFVEARPGPDAGHRLSTTATQVGSSAAFAAEIDGVRVTAVGEVPEKTVRFIVNQVQLGVRAAANDASQARLPTAPGALRPAPVPMLPGGRSTVPALVPRGPPRTP